MTDKQLLERIKTRKAVVGIMGMGYVGLPLSITFCDAGFSVVGFDVDAPKIKLLKQGKSYIEHIPSRLIAKMRGSGRFDATTDMKRLKKCDAILICVPTPLNETRDPDMRFVVGTCEAILPNLRKGHLVILESTTYPGTTRDLLRPILERRGLKAGRDFYMAYSPEREDPGREDFTTATIPKVVGADDAKSRKLATALYGGAVSMVVPVGSTQIAEAAKIVENVYRCVNIAMVNELKMVMDRMGIDVWEVIRAAATKPFGYAPFYPGPGLGGHCIPIDPFYLSWKARQYGMPTRFIELAGEINTQMPEYVVSRVADALNQRSKPLKNSTILVLGIAYKRDVDDCRESPAIELIELLTERGAKVDYNDPHVPRAPHQRKGHLQMSSKKLSPAMLKKYDCVLIATDHTRYDYDMIVKNAPLVVDTRNATNNVKGKRANVVKA